MDEYLENLRRRPHHHKKYFALGVSGCFTAIIFLIWSFVHFGGTAAVVAENIPTPSPASEAISPFENIGSGLASSWSALKDQFSNTEATLRSVDLDTRYQDMRNDALNN